MKEGNLKDRKHQKQDVLKIGCTQIGCTKNRRIYYVWCVLLLQQEDVLYTLEPCVHECVRHLSRTVFIPTYIQWCDIIPPWLGKEHSNRVRHSNHSQARRALGCRRPHSNRASKNIIGSTKYRKAQRQERIHRRNHSQEVTRQEHRIISSFFCVSY